MDFPVWAVSLESGKTVAQVTSYEAAQAVVRLFGPVYILPVAPFERACTDAINRVRVARGESPQ
jgi:hypothetical protein